MVVRWVMTKYNLRSKTLNSAIRRSSRIQVKFLVNRMAEANVNISDLAPGSSEGSSNMVPQQDSVINVSEGINNQENEISVINNTSGVHMSGTNHPQVQGSGTNIGSTVTPSSTTNTMAPVVSNTSTTAVSPGVSTLPTRDATNPIPPYFNNPVNADYSMYPYLNSVLHSVIAQVMSNPQSPIVVPAPQVPGVAAYRVPTSAPGSTVTSIPNPSVTIASPAVSGVHLPNAVPVNTNQTPTRVTTAGEPFSISPNGSLSNIPGLPTQPQLLSLQPSQVNPSLTKPLNVPTNPMLQQKILSGASSPDSSVGTSMCGTVIVDRPYLENLPKFHVEDLPRNPIERNIKVEAWIKNIEAILLNISDEKMKVSLGFRAIVDNTASIFSLPQFINVKNWSNFKDAIRYRFQTAVSVENIHRYLEQLQLKEGHTLRDFSCLVWSRVEDVNGTLKYNAEQLELYKKQIFCEGLPVWMRTRVAMVLAIKTFEELVQYAMSLESKYGRDRKGDRIVASERVTPESPYVATTNNEKYIPPHRRTGGGGRNKQNARRTNQCWECGGIGHIRANCPNFRS
ncbi:uncharacterized protein [Cherax quadricarinatus]|uniref:uncharacterized protein n=1 Tax=Cherax quadricarinatus TaxID=27406 RepID=UPI00387E9403